MKNMIINSKLFANNLSNPSNSIFNDTNGLLSISKKAEAIKAGIILLFIIRSFFLL